MRIGTWNLEAKWTARHKETLTGADCDIWLLTEVNPLAVLDGFNSAWSPALMSAGQHFAAVFARFPLEALPAPHPASAAGSGCGVAWCSSVLPWNGAKSEPPWVDGDTATKTEVAVKEIVAALPRHCVWGGDWNHPLSGPDRGFYKGRGITGAATAELGLQIPTAPLPSRRPGAMSIDHIAVPGSWTVVGTEHHAIRRSVSDHDLYVVDVRIPVTEPGLA